MLNRVCCTRTSFLGSYEQTNSYGDDTRRQGSTAQLTLAIIHVNSRIPAALDKQQRKHPHYYD